MADCCAAGLASTGGPCKLAVPDLRLDFWLMSAKEDVTLTAHLVMALSPVIDLALEVANGHHPSCFMDSNHRGNSD